MTARLVRLARTGTIALCAVMVLIGGSQTMATAARVASTGTVTGTISDPGGYPLAGITIRLYDDGPDDGSVVGTATTNGAGRYTFSKVATKGKDSYRFEANDPSGAHIYTYSPTFFVRPGETTNKGATMKIAGFIQGKVFTKDGDDSAPASHVVVTADGTREGGDVKVSAKGAFRLGGLPTGTYTVNFQDSSERFAPICYNHVRMTDKGCGKGTVKVKVTAGKTTTLKRQVLDHRLGELYGTVTDTAGTPLKNMTVNIVSATHQDDVIGSATSNANGDWDRPGLTYVGKVKIVATDDAGVYRTTWHYDAVDFAHATVLTLTDGGEIADIGVVMPLK